MKTCFPEVLQGSMQERRCGVLLVSKNDEQEQIFEAGGLVSVRLCVQELQGLGQSVDADHSNFIHVENVYESVLLQTLDKEVTKGKITLVRHARPPSQGQRHASNPPAVFSVLQW